MHELIAGSLMIEKLARFFEFWVQYARKINLVSKLATRKFITAMAKSCPPEKSVELLHFIIRLRPRRLVRSR